MLSSVAEETERLAECRLGFDDGFMDTRRKRPAVWNNTLHVRYTESMHLMQFARRQRLMSALTEYFISNCYRNSVLLCRRISFLSCFSRNSNSYERFNGMFDALRKTNSEPCLPSALIATPIYRTEEVEFVVKPDTTQLDIVDWNLFTPPTIGSIPRVYFIAFLSIKTDNKRDEFADGIVLADSFAATDEPSSGNCDLTSFNGVPPTMVGDLCNKIAHRRGRPWEILYECTLYDFYDIAFAWSQNALFDISGKAFVQMMQVMTLPEAFFLPPDGGDSLPQSSSSALDCKLCFPFAFMHSRSVSPEPLTLLEVLYQREHGFTMEMDNDELWNFHGSCSAFVPFHSSDSALHQLPFPAVTTSKLSDGVPNNAHVESASRKSALRSRTCSASPERALSLPREAAPLYIKYLKEQNEMEKPLPRYSRSLPLCRETRKSVRRDKHIMPSSVNLPSADQKDIQKIGLTNPAKAIPPAVVIEPFNPFKNTNRTMEFAGSKSDARKLGQVQVNISQFPYGSNEAINRSNRIQIDSNQSHASSEHNQVEFSSVAGQTNDVPIRSNQIPNHSNQVAGIVKLTDAVIVASETAVEKTAKIQAGKKVAEHSVILKKREPGPGVTERISSGADEDQMSRRSRDVPEREPINAENERRIQNHKNLGAIDMKSGSPETPNLIADELKPAYSSAAVITTNITQQQTDKSASSVESNGLSQDGSRSKREDQTSTIDSQRSSVAVREMLSLATSGRRGLSLSTLPEFAYNASLQNNRSRSCDPSLHSLYSSLFRMSEKQSSLFGKAMFQSVGDAAHHRRLHIVADGGRAHAKPLMILVFTGDNKNLFDRISSTLAKMVPSDTYTTVHLSYEALCKHPWIGRDAACLIVADTAHLDDSCWSRIQQYFNSSGKMLFLCQNNLLASLSACDTSKKSSKLLKVAFGERQSKKLGKEFENFLKKTLKALHKEKKVNQTFHAKDPVGGYKYSVVLSKAENSPLLLYMENAAQQASALFSDATSEQLLNSGSSLIADVLSRLSIKVITNIQLPALTKGYFICEYDRMPWDMEGMRFNEAFGTMPKLLLRQIKKHGPLPQASSELLPVEVRTRAEQLPDFDTDIYFKRLKTSKLGKALIYIPVCETTVDIGKSLAFAMPEEPIIVVAQRQTKGKGRSGNQWLSPIGCAMFTFNYTVPNGSPLARNVGFIQHIFCVAIADGVCSLHKDLEDFPLKIKWPNDLYYGRTYKMGGLIVNATTISGKTVCTISAGLNLSNSKPTICVNDLLPPHLKIRQEDYFANTLNKFQYYIDLYQTVGQDAFLEHYYRFWLHSKEEVTLADTSEKVVIRGLDRYGFLEVQNRQTGQVMAVHPDGNTFDMMKGLITAKYI